MTSIPSSSTATSTAIPDDCLACRITGTLTFAAVGTYALTVARNSAKTTMGRGAASVVGLGFLAIAAVRWTNGQEEEKK